MTTKNGPMNNVPRGHTLPILGVFAAALVLLPFLSFSVCGGQIPTQPAQPRTSEEALLVVRRTIGALGSEAAWSAISSIESTATITSNAGPTRNIIWADNWSTGTLKYKRAPKAARPASCEIAPPLHQL